MPGDWPCEKCGLIFNEWRSLRSHSGHCNKGPRYLLETLVDTGSYNLSGTRRRSGHSKLEDEFTLFNDFGVELYGDPIDEEVEDEVKDNDLSEEEEEDVQSVEEPMEARARLYRIDELPEKTNNQMTYYKEQVEFGHIYYGEKAMKTSSPQEFIDEVSIHYTVSITIEFYLKL